jgi:hypothetical protein
MTHTTTLRRFGSVAPTGAGVAISALHPAYRTGRTIFSSRVFDPAEVGRVLKDGHHSRKIGRAVTKGHRRGWPIFTLTLEERATCPRTCAAWSFCYGNGMHAAEPIVAGAELEQALWYELEALQAEHPRGFMIRLHILGDFYSLDYVSLWARALAAFPGLHVFGFTARNRDSDPIGRALFELAMLDWDRFAIRFSGAGGDLWASRIGDHDPEAIACPAQTGATECCASCSVCWASQRSISFARH